MRARCAAAANCSKSLTVAAGIEAKTDGSDSSAPSQREAAEAAGMSSRQQVTAVRVANVDAEIFDAAVHFDKPPTITKLAETGTKTRLGMTRRRVQAGDGSAGDVERFAKFCAANDPVFVAGGVLKHEAKFAREQVALVDALVDLFVVNIETERWLPRSIAIGDQSSARQSDVSETAMVGDMIAISYLRGHKQPVGIRTRSKHVLFWRYSGYKTIRELVTQTFNRQLRRFFRSNPNDTSWLHPASGILCGEAPRR